MKVPNNCPWCNTRLTPDSIEGTVYSCIAKCYKENDRHSPIAYCLTDTGPNWEDLGSIWITTKEYKVRWDLEKKTTAISKRSSSLFDTLVVLNYLTEIQYDREKLNAWAKELHKLTAFT